ncbi:jerky protein homolog-like isoform X3 [Anolis sagrei]|uniref:jerky protein homolog-like isoform X3 n=1 Tax=Anolis sagrei TaxID=38937 RepID=UPI0035225141
MEELNPASLQLEQGMRREGGKAGSRIQSKYVPNGPMWKAVEERNELPGQRMQLWEAQWQEFLKTLQSPSSTWGKLPPAEQTPWDEAKAFLASFEQVAKACRWPKEEWAARLLPALSGEVEQAFWSLEAGDRNDYEKVKAAILRVEALRAELQRQHFRQFCCQEVEDPRRVYSQVQELCSQWLKPERRSKEQILELLVLEQFLASLPQDLQGWVRGAGPETCSQAVALAEDFLLKRQQETNSTQWQGPSLDVRVGSLEAEGKSLRAAQGQIYEEAKPVKEAEIPLLGGGIKGPSPSISVFPPEVQIKTEDGLDEQDAANPPVHQAPATVPHHREQQEQVWPHSQRSSGPLSPQVHTWSFSSASVATKRKKVVVSMEQKLEAIKRLDKGEMMQKVANEYGVARVTVGEWKKNRLEIEKWCSSRVTDGALKERKTMKKCRYEKVSEALYVWFIQFRDIGVPISGPILQQKALHFRKEFNEGDLDFTASSGWLDRWKKRYGIRQFSVCCEKLSSNDQELEAFKKKFQDFVETESLTSDQIFNCDETGLSYKMLPSWSLAARTEAASPGYKHSKERLTILACSNATANHKMDLVMIGKSKYPSAFETIVNNALPVKYYSQRSASMTSEIFKDWFLKEFVPSTEKFLKEKDLPRKAVLLLDNAPTHPDAEELQDGDIKAIFLPPNVTAICQPMKQGILVTLKRNYRRNLLSTMIDEIKGGQDIIEKLKRISVKEVAYWVARAWTDVRAPTIARAWKTLLGGDQDDIIKRESTDESEESILPLVQRIPGCENASLQEVESWMNDDDQYEITDEDIVALVNSDGDGDEIGDQA